MTMRRCRSCRGVLDGEPDELGARCPHCRQPLYERQPRNDGIPKAELVDPDLCAVHPTAPARSTCPRCGNFMCDVCRTRFRDRLLCVACVERGLQVDETATEESRAHRRQATLSAVLGAGAWLTAVLGIAIIAASLSSGETELIGLSVMLFLLGLGCAALGLPQGAAAIRARGDRMILATIGLLLCGLFTGLVLGFISVSIWKQ